MNRTLVLGDIHGELSLLEKVLDKANFSPADDKLIVLGDIVDRGANPKETLRYLISLSEIADTVFLKGNHEEMAIEFVQAQLCSKNKAWKNHIKEWYYRNGGKTTVESYGGDLYEMEEDLLVTNSWPCTYQAGQYIFVHAGLRPGIPYHMQKKEDLLWIREDFIYHDWSDYKYTIIHGHTPTKEVVTTGKTVNLDTGAGKGGKLSLLDFKNGIVYDA